MMLDVDSFQALVAEASASPSVHNTQPTLWRLDSDGAVTVLEASDRRLPVGDPLGRDADVSHGAAVEGFALAASARGWRLEMTPLGGNPGQPNREVARLTLTSGGDPDPLHAWMARRQSYRGAFPEGMARRSQAGLAALAADGDARVVTAPGEVAHLAGLNDLAALATYRDGAFRAELLSWMRLSRGDPCWARDGLNAQALCLPSFEAACAAIVLRPRVFEVLDRLKLARALVKEAKVVRSSHALVLFHRPASEPPLITGRRFHRLWLQFTQMGLVAAPMSVLADDPDTRVRIAGGFGISADRRLITAFRLGPEPRSLPPRARLPIQETVV